MLVKQIPLVVAKIAVKTIQTCTYKTNKFYTREQQLMMQNEHPKAHPGHDMEAQAERNGKLYVRINYIHCYIIHTAV